MQGIRHWRPLILLAVAGWLAACGEAGQPPPAARPPPAVMSPGDRARAVVAERLQVPVDQVAVITVTPTDFPDSSLGCPEPDMQYQQVVTPGYQVLVEAEGRRFDVRVAGAGARICHRRKGNTRGSQRATPLQSLAERARADLAARLQCAVAAVSISGVRALRPGDELAGCTVSCAAGTAGCGYAVALRHDGRLYEYFVNDAELRPCPPILPG